jgi:hypothetical protein
MSIILELPKVPKLECKPDGKVGKKELDAYFKNIARTTNRLKVSTVGLQLDDECSLAVIAAVTAIQELTSKTLDPVTTQPFTNFKSLELEAKYRARELSKDIEEFFKKEVVDILLTIANILNIPNPFKVPIPFLGTATLLNESGEPYVYDPVIEDLFTKEGQKKVKAAAKEDLESIKKFFTDLESTFDGSLGIKAPDLEAEEAWHKIKNWFDQLMNDFIKTSTEAIGNIVKNIPIIGKPIYDLVFSSIDPTIAIEASFDKLVEEYKKKIKQAKEDFLSGKAAEDLGEKLLKEATDLILGIQIPILGSVGDFVDIDLKNKDIVIAEFDFHEVEDAFKELIQKARRFFEGDLLVKIYDIIAKAPSTILSQFPIVGTIFKALKKVVDILSGKNPLTECEVLNIIFPAIFTIGTLVVSLLPGCVEVVFVE